MSLINQMLHDLDARRAGVEERGLPPAVTPLPRARRPAGLLRPWHWLLPLAPVAAAAAWWLGREPVVPAAPSVPPVVAAAPVSATGEPALRLDADLDHVPAGPPARREARPAPERSARAAGQAEAAAPKAAAAESPAVAAPREAERVSGVTPKHVMPREVPQLAESSIDKQMRTPGAAERADIEYRRGVMLQRQGQVDEALARFRAALGIHAEHAAARQGLVNLLLEQRRYDDAEAALQQGIEIPAARLSSVMTLARLKVERGQPVAATELMLAHAAVGERSAEFQGFAGALLHRAGRSAEAAERYQAATRLAPNEARWWAGLGIALDASGKGADAREAFMRARGLPNLPAELAVIVEQRLR